MSRGAWIGVAAFFVVVATVPAWITQQVAGEVSKQPFDPVPERLISGVRPGYVFLGNSMLDTRIIPGVFAEQAGAPAMIFSIPGVMSAAWYLQLKHQIAAADPAPAMVFVLFRDTHLTRPQLRTGGRYAKWLESLRPDEDEELAAVLAGSAEHLPWYARAWGLPQWWLGWLYPADKALRRGQHWLPEVGLRLLGRDEAKRKELRVRLDRTFGRDRFRDASGADVMPSASEAVYDFNGSVGWSFLPLMLSEAESAGIRLCFVRVRTRRAAMGLPEPEALSQYMRDLKTWLTRRKACFVDMKFNPAISLDWYSDGDHIRPSRREAYTRLFYDAVRDQLP
ncbi:MAG: hypothetical protein LJE84_08150 [Gammaproteobacteria bacterium]|nr:hypothetical protein [Gammaproteobacteria bacterium]